MRHSPLLALALILSALPAFAGKGIGDYMNCSEKFDQANSCPYPDELFKRDPAFKKHLAAARKTANVPNIEGPESRLLPIQIAGRPYLWASRCQVHNCDEHRFVFLVGADGEKINGLYQPDGKPSRYFGNPDAAEQGKLQELLHH